MRTAYQAQWLSLSTLLIFSLVAFGPTISEGSLASFFSFFKNAWSPIHPKHESKVTVTNKPPHHYYLKSEGGQAFCYDDPSCGPESDAWGGICHSGTEQSPVDLPFNSYNHRNGPLYRVGPDETYNSPQAFTLKNNGHTVQASLQPDLTSTSVLEGSLLGGRYVFSQLHFHWGSNDEQGSEHTFNGFKYPMEAHLVHYHEKYNSFMEAMSSNEPGAVAVIGRVFRVSYVDGEEVEPIVRLLNQVESHGSSVEGNDLNLGSFLRPTTGLKYLTTIQYNGSLTTPGCNEGVLWTVSASTLQISRKQLQAFRNLQANEDGSVPLVDNFRPVQEKGEREYVASFTEVIFPESE